MGTLWYLTKHSRLDITNAVRELSKSMDRVSRLQLQELKRFAKFVLDMKDLGLCIVPNINDGIWCLVLEALSNSDFANDKEQGPVFMETLYSSASYLSHGRAKE